MRQSTAEPPRVTFRNGFNGFARGRNAGGRESRVAGAAVATMTNHTTTTSATGNSRSTAYLPTSIPALAPNMCRMGPFALVSR